MQATTNICRARTVCRRANRRAAGGRRRLHQAPADDGPALPDDFDRRGAGALDAGRALTLAKRVGLVLAILWSVALGAVLLFPLMFPPHQGGSFRSQMLLAEREPFDFLNLHIPTNPFYSLANNIVPAVVLFSQDSGPKTPRWSVAHGVLNWW